MPKKTVKNAFYYYMVDYKEQQRKKGINYGNMVEVALAAGLFWKNEPAPVRAKFEEIAKKEKQKYNGSGEKFTSNGIPFSVIEQRERELKEAMEVERLDIQDMIKLKFVSNSLLELEFYLMDVNFFCQAGKDYLIGESSLIRFNLLDGIKGAYHEMINPGQIPTGYAYDVKIGCQEYGLVMPDESSDCSNYVQLLANIVDFLKQHDRNVKILPPIFTMPDKVVPVQNFILHICRRTGEDESLFRVYKLDMLFFTLINTIKTGKYEGFPKESLAIAQLKKDLFRYTPGLGCLHHEEIDKSIECATSRAKRWAFTILDSCCPLVGIDLEAGKHLPSDYDVDGILTYKEQKKERAGPSIAGCKLASSFFSDSTLIDSTLKDSSANDSLLDTTAGSLDTSLKEKRTNPPVRMPKGDYSQMIRVAPKIDDRPNLIYPNSAGRGRGSSSRNLAGSFGKMNIDKETK